MLGCRDTLGPLKSFDVGLGIWNMILITAASVQASLGVSERDRLASLGVWTCTSLVSSNHGPFGESFCFQLNLLG